MINVDPRFELACNRDFPGERLAEESLAVLLELIVERGDPVPRIMRDFALLRIRGETRGKLRKSPWAMAVSSPGGRLVGNHSISLSMAGMGSVCAAWYCRVQRSICRPI